MTQILVLYYSTYGHVEAMAGAVAEGARSVDGTGIHIKSVPETMPKDVARGPGTKLDPVASQLACLLVDHLSFADIDAIDVEALVTALTVKGPGAAVGKEKQIPTLGTDTRIARAIEYIEAHLDEAISLANIASAACMSPSWLKSSFRAVTGKTVWTYVRERRLERARQMLANPNHSLARIAYECGFSSHSHMSRLFRQHYGASPKEMRP